MRGIDTGAIMETALGLVGWKEIPPDSGIHVPGQNIKKLIFTMDANVGLLHLAKERGFDALVGHHPCGVLFHRGEVYRRHIDLMERHGISRAKALEVLGKAIEGTVERMENHRFRMLYSESPNQTVLEVDAARLLHLPFMNIHNPLDELGRRILQAKIDDAFSRKPGLKLRDILSLMEELPEARYARKAYGISPYIPIGDRDSEASRTVFVHGALAAPSAEIVRFYWQSGIRTIIALHSEFEDLQKLKALGQGNLILTGHFLGDSIGMTPFIRALRGQGVEVVCMGGIIDVEGDVHG